MRLWIQRALGISVACVLSLVWAVRSAGAELEESLLQASRNLFALAEHWQVAEPRALYLNGARVIVATGRSEQPLALVLDHFQNHCRAHSGGLHPAWLQITDPKLRAPAPDGVLRIDGDDVGMVACLDLGEKTLSAQEMADRLGRFAETLDLTALGGVRMVRAQRAGAKTFFVAAFSDGPVSLSSMFPDNQDCPGQDLRDAPRPMRATRILSAWQEGHASELHVYQTKTSVDDAFERYAAAMEQSGWTLHDDTRLSSAEVFGAVFVRGHDSVVVDARADGPESRLTVLAMGTQRSSE